MATEKKDKKLSKVMLECIESVKRHGTLVRWKGGYWTRQGCPPRQTNDETVIPEWWYNWSTIKSLIDRGLLMVTEENYNGYDLKYYPVAVKLKQ